MSQRLESARYKRTLTTDIVRYVDSYPKRLVVNVETSTSIRIGRALPECVNPRLICDYHAPMLDSLLKC